MTTQPPFDLRSAYEAAKAAQIKTAAELLTARRELRRLKLIRDFPIIEAVVDLVSGEDDDTFVSNGRALAAALSAARDGASPAAATSRPPRAERP